MTAQTTVHVRSSRNREQRGYGDAARNVLTRAIVFVLFSVGSVGLLGGQEVSLTAAPLKVGYRSGEAVQVKFELQNLSQKRTLVGSTFALNYFINLHIEGPERKTRWCGRISSAAGTSKPYIVLRPGGHVSKIITISCSGSATAGYDLSTPGHYIVKAEYAMPTPRKAFKGSVDSSVAIPRGPVPAAPFELNVTAQ